MTTSPASAVWRRTPQERLADLATFARHHVYASAGDADPNYPVLKHQERGLGREAALWYSLLYVAFCNLIGCARAFAAAPTLAALPLPPESATWTTDVERRGLRGGRIALHLASLADLIRRDGGGSVEGWLTRGFTRDRAANWRLILQRVREPWGNGRWAAYKYGEVLRSANDLPIDAPDMGHADSTGPRAGLELLYGPVTGNSPAAIARLDAQGADLQARLRDEYDLPLRVDQVETVLCDWHGLANGSHYVGYDNDLLLSQMWRERARLGGPAGPRDDAVLTRLWASRRAVVPAAYLGEANGDRWRGIERDRTRVYRDAGAIVVRVNRAAA